MFRILKMGSAFIGIIVGAGFASGQEVLQYFTSFGYLGTAGAIAATLLFAYLGMMLTKIGSRLQTTSHRKAIYTISGRYLGVVIDYIIVFTLFGVGVVMVAGAGSILNQQFGFNPHIGSLILIVLVILTVMMNVQKVINVIGSITPFLVLAIVLIAVYSLFTIDQSFAALDPIAKEQDSAIPDWFKSWFDFAWMPHWLVSGINYVSFNIAVGVSMSLVMGGTEKNEKTAAMGGFVGGLGLGVLIILSHLAIFSKVDVVASFEMPTLKIVNDISPVLAILMSLVLFGMIFNTAVSMFYAFAARFTPLNTKRFHVFVIVTGLVGFIASFAGFTELVNFLYPLIGFLGLLLIATLIYAPFHLSRQGIKNNRTDDISKVG